MSPIPRDPPVTSATLPSIEKRSFMGPGRRALAARSSTDQAPAPRVHCAPGTGGPSMGANHSRRDAMGAAVQLDASVERFVKTPVRKMLIDGKWVEAASGKTFETPNPATGEVLARVAEGDKEDVDRAVRAARRT